MRRRAPRLLYPPCAVFAASSAAESRFSSDEARAPRPSTHFFHFLGAVCGLRLHCFPLQKPPALADPRRARVFLTSCGCGTSGGEPVRHLASTWAGAPRSVALHEYRVFPTPRRAQARVRAACAGVASRHWLHVGAVRRQPRRRPLEWFRTVASPHRLQLLSVISCLPANVLRGASSHSVSGPPSLPCFALFSTLCCREVTAFRVSCRPVAASDRLPITRSVSVCNAQPAGGLRSAA